MHSISAPRAHASSLRFRSTISSLTQLCLGSLVPAHKKFSRNSCSTCAKPRTAKVIVVSQKRERPHNRASQTPRLHRRGPVPSREKVEPACIRDEKKEEERLDPVLYARDNKRVRVCRHIRESRTIRETNICHVRGAYFRFRVLSCLTLLRREKVTYFWNASIPLNWSILCIFAYFLHQWALDAYSIARHCLNWIVNCVSFKIADFLIKFEQT